MKIRRPRCGLMRLCGELTDGPFTIAVDLLAGRAANDKKVGIINKRPKPL